VVALDDIMMNSGEILRDGVEDRDSLREIERAGVN
jgi:hypothetical protein